MIELKVHCDCGQKYKFDVEPVNGAMPFAVACPICRLDGTPKANAMLQQMAIFRPVAAPAPAAAGVAPPPAPIAPPVGPARIHVNAPAPVAAPSHSVAAPPPIGPATHAPPPFSGRPQPGAASATASVDPGGKPNFMMGLLGALLGALVGSILYFFIYKAIGPVLILRYVLALGVGGLTGWLANLLGKGEGSKELGALAAVFTVVGILAAQYSLTMAQFHQEEADNAGVTQAIEDGGYADSVKDAGIAVRAIPNGTDAEIRMYLAKQQAEAGQAPKLEQVDNDQVKEFRDTEWTNYQDLASGKLTKEQYWAKNGFDSKEAGKILAVGETAVNGLAAIIAVLRAGIVSMIVAAGLAFRLSKNARGG